MIVNSVIVDTTAVAVAVIAEEAVDTAVKISGNIIVVTSAPPLESQDSIAVVVEASCREHACAPWWEAHV